MTTSVSLHCWGGRCDLRDNLGLCDPMEGHLLREQARTGKFVCGFLKVYVDCVRGLWDRGADPGSVVVPILTSHVILLKIML